MSRWLWRHIFPALDVLKFLGIIILLFMFIRFNAAVANNAKQTRATADQTNRIVKSQNEILDAIKQLALDNKITSEQKANLIICMLQVPVDQRTTDTLAQCRRDAEPTASNSTPSAAPSPAPTPSPTPTPSQQPNPSPNPSPSLIQQTGQFISNVVKRIL
jgi:hypothetical protein